MGNIFITNFTFGGREVRDDIRCSLKAPKLPVSIDYIGTDGVHGSNQNWIEKQQTWTLWKHWEAKTLKRWTSAPGHDASCPMQTSSVGLPATRRSSIMEGAFNCQMILSFHIFLLLAGCSWKWKDSKTKEILMILLGVSLTGIHWITIANPSIKMKKMRFESNEMTAKILIRIFELFASKRIYCIRFRAYHNYMSFHIISNVVENRVLLSK